MDNASCIGRLTECSGAVSSSLGEEQSPFRGDPDYAMKFVASVDAEYRSYGGTVAYEFNMMADGSSELREADEVEVVIDPKDIELTTARAECQQGLSDRAMAEDMNNIQP
ncbi:hypothetical protein Sjap_013052 [Stephania japonica]|uniref:Uncharacterized protein n=1 Tax=Stephania japonica TaxID=461633 RepID=A0AAP0IYE6_9MAGN